MSNVLTFPGKPVRRDSLTEEECDRLLALTATLIGSWACDFALCEQRHISAMLIPRLWGDGETAAFLVCRQKRRLLLIDQRGTAVFGNPMVGDGAVTECATMDELLACLRREIGARGRPPGYQPPLPSDRQTGPAPSRSRGRGPKKDTGNSLAETGIRSHLSVVVATERP